MNGIHKRIIKSINKFDNKKNKVNDKRVHSRMLFHCIRIRLVVVVVMMVIIVKQVNYCCIYAIPFGTQSIWLFTPLHFGDNIRLTNVSWSNKAISSSETRGKQFDLIASKISESTNVGSLQVHIYIFENNIFIVSYCNDDHLYIQICAYVCIKSIIEKKNVV